MSMAAPVTAVGIGGECDLSFEWSVDCMSAVHLHEYLEKKSFKKGSFLQNLNWTPALAPASFPLKDADWSGTDRKCLRLQLFLMDLQDFKLQLPSEF